MERSSTTEYGPEFLFDLADRMSGDNQEHQAIAFRQAARNFQRTEKDLEEARTEVTRLHAQLTAVRRAAAGEVACA